MKFHAKAVYSRVRKVFGNKQNFGAEVGVWRGQTSAALLERLPNLYLYLIDLYHPKDMFRSRDVKNMKEAYAEARAAVKPYPLRTCWIIKDTLEAARDFEDGQLDWVFIDADHKYASVLKDITAWHPKVREGGIVMGHDYDGVMDKNGKYGVKPAVDEWVAAHGYELDLGSGHVWCYYK